MHVSTLFLAIASGSAAAATSVRLPQCSPRVAALAYGIHLNILGQHSELNATETLQAIEKAHLFPLDLLEFEQGKGSLVALIETGQTIRSNQGIAPKNNKANPGLAKIASAQTTELALAKSLTGEQLHDKSVLATLVSDIITGTKLNEQNLAAAIDGCSLGFEFPASA